MPMSSSVGGFMSQGYMNARVHENKKGIWCAIRCILFYLSAKRVFYSTFRNRLLYPSTIRGFYSMFIDEWVLPSLPVKFTKFRISFTLVEQEHRRQIIFVVRLSYFNNASSKTIKKTCIDSKPGLEIVHIRWW